MISLQTVNRSKFTERRPDGTDRELKSHEMGMQVSCGMDTEMQAEGIIWRFAEISWRCAEEVSATEGM